METCSCGAEDEYSHVCVGCEVPISEYRCKEHGSLCGECEWLLGK